MRAFNLRASAFMMLFSLVMFGFSMTAASAATCGDKKCEPPETAESCKGDCFVGPPTAPTDKKTYALSNPLGTTDFRVLTGRAIRIVTGISGSVGLLMFIYGGFTWLTSGGSPEKIKQGKKIFVTAALGLIIIFGSYALLRALFAALSGFENVAI